MKNILLVSSLYPTDDIQIKNNTAVCHYFAKEWMQMGYKVRVINLYNVYPWYYYPILHIAKNILADRYGDAILDTRIQDEYDYEIEGIRVTRIPAYKSKPHGDFSNKVITALAEKIYNLTQKEKFEPDYILGHFLRPNIMVIAALKELYPNAVSTTALHGEETRILPSVLLCLPKIDYIGYRSYPIKKKFEALYGKKPYFMCMSGVPETYITDNPKQFENGIHNYIYVGSFIRRKYPSCLIPAIAENYPQMDFSITYVGDGKGITRIQKVAKKCEVENQIIFTGRINRSEIVSRLDSADVFIMISEYETFGLVWLEAMARGCITIASRDEGMDGIIKEGENGFLCKAGDIQELSIVIDKIRHMRKGDLQIMSKKAIETAQNMTDKKMAEEYINGIKKQSCSTFHKH